MPKIITENYALIPTGDARTSPYDWGSLRFLIDASDDASLHASMLIATIKGGCRNMLHRHPNCDELLHLLQGRIRHAAGDQWIEMNPGDTLRISRGVPHQAQVLSAEDAIMVVVYSAGNRETEAVQLATASEEQTGR